jgi:hypothetical protein
VNWVGGSGDWGTAENWLDIRTGTNHVPTAADDAVINVPGVTVTHSAGTDAVRSLLSRDPFVLSGGTLDLGAASTVNDSFTLSAPSGSTTLRGAGDLTVTGSFTWTGGTMTGAGHTVARGGLAMSTSSNLTRLDGRTLDNFGTAVWTGSSALPFANGARLDNLAGATFEVWADAGITTSGLPSLFSNAGTFRKAASSGITTVEIPFNNSGAVEVQTGTLELRGGGDSTRSFLVEDGTTLSFAGVNSILRASSTVAGNGTVRAFATDFPGNSTLSILGGYSAATLTVAGGTVDIARDVTLANLTLSGGHLTGLGTMTVTGVMNWLIGGALSGLGTTTIASSGVLNLSGGTLDGRTLNADFHGGECPHTDAARPRCFPLAGRGPCEGIAGPVGPCRFA